MSTSTEPIVPDVSRLHPAGGKRSSKRERILAVFLKHEGHLSADDLVDLIHREDARISRATVYRTLQWMVDAGIARKVDFGEGRFRFEHSYRHPRHFHLICKNCNRSSEFLSSDIEALIEEVAGARGFSARQSVLQIYGTCEACRAGRPAQPEPNTSELVFARDALRIAIATERSGLEFYSRAARMTTHARGRRVFQKLADEERDHLATLEDALPAPAPAGPAARVAADVPLLQGRRQRPVRRGGRRGRAGRRRSAGAQDRHPLRADVAPLLQALRRAVRGLGRQADLPRVRRRGARAPRPAAAGVHPADQGRRARRRGSAQPPVGGRPEHARARR